ncbi:hypothetical protein [Streptomyces abikoensis]|uniref:hypothetical protein n=1 Tax=Streptomyces abikoensis TaxID=97398 RepID=UPI0036C60122
MFVASSSGVISEAQPSGGSWYGLHAPQAAHVHRPWIPWTTAPHPAHVSVV